MTALFTMSIMQHPDKTIVQVKYDNEHVVLETHNMSVQSIMETIKLS